MFRYFQKLLIFCLFCLKLEISLKYKRARLNFGPFPAFTEFDNPKLTTRTTCEKLRQIAKVKANLLGN